MRTRLAILGGITVALLVACPSRPAVVSDNTQKPVETPAIIVEPVQQPVQNPKGVSIVSIKDINGNLFDMKKEANVNKNVDLLAAQYEDALCLRVQVKDAASANIANALVKVQDTSLREASISPGCVSGALGTTAFGEVRTDANGEAFFTIFAPSPEAFLDGILPVNEPVKYVVSAVSPDNRVAAEPLEFKVFYLNMSHLYFGDRTSAQGQIPLVPERKTTQRWGQDLGVIRNVFRDLPCVGPACVNNHYFGTWAFVKQPQSGPFPIPDTQFPGYMRYELADATNVMFVDNGACEDIQDNGRVCIDNDADASVAITPRPNMTVDDLPITATVRAVYMAQFTYGATQYTFPLKMYRFTKTWTGSNATIEKWVDNHVLTWAGPDFFKSATNPEREDMKTLAATNQTNVVKASQQVFTTTVHLKVTNTGSEPLYRLTIRDAVPAELGVMTDANGIILNSNLKGTYDPIKHVITWDWTANQGIESLAAGATQEVTFTTYARQKPGYCWDAGLNQYTVQPGATVTTPFTGCAYADAYRVVNGRLANDVTVAYYMSNDFDVTTVQGMENLSNQQVRDYTPTNANSEIWVVRPLYTLTKTLIAPQPNDLMVGQAATFKITLSQIDRTKNEYANLKAMYPNEFPGGTGRLNPYGIGVRLEDRFTNELDFTAATPLTVVPGLGPNNSYDEIWTSANSKLVKWNIPGYQVFAANDVGTAMVTLNADSITATQEGPISGFATLIRDNECVQGSGAAWNCAFFNADNLNQQTVDPNSYGNAIPWKQYEGVYYHGGMANNVAILGLGNVLVPTEVGTWTAGTWLISCDFVNIYEQQMPVVGLTARNESTNGLPTAPTGAGDPYPLGTEFFYRYDINTRTAGDIAKLTFQTDLGDGTIVQYRTNLPVRIFKSTDDGATFTEITNVPGAFPIVNFTATTVVSGEFTLPGNTLFRVIIPAKAVGVGDLEVITATLREFNGILHTADDSTRIF